MAETTPFSSTSTPTTLPTLAPSEFTWVTEEVSGREARRVRSKLMVWPVMPWVPGGPSGRRLPGPKRRIYYDALMQGYRGWLGELPPEVAHAIAWGNGARLFELAPPTPP